MITTVLRALGLRPASCVSVAPARAERDADDRQLAQRYLNKAKGANLTVGVSRKWNDGDLRTAYITGRRDEREDPR